MPYLKKLVIVFTTILIAISSVANAGYVANDPVNNVDPDGRQLSPFTMHQVDVATRAQVEADPVAAAQARNQGYAMGAVLTIALPATAGLATAAFTAPATMTELVVGGGELAMGDAAGAGLGLTGLVSAADNLASKAGSFFDGASYTSKVETQMQMGDFHAFPESVTGFADAGTISTITGGDGVAREMLQIPGGYSGREGNFTFIKDADGSINHRMFEPELER